MVTRDIAWLGQAWLGSTWLDIVYLARWHFLDAHPTTVGADRRLAALLVYMVLRRFWLFGVSYSVHFGAFSAIFVFSCSIVTGTACGCCCKAPFFFAKSKEK